MSDFWWDDASRLLKDIGQEDDLADRIQQELSARGWSQERLAREMTNAGCPIPQSAISKIIKPPPSGRRAITVDEAIALSRVFDIPLPLLVLPREAMQQQQLLRDVKWGPQTAFKVIKASEDYMKLLQRIAAATRGDTSWLERFRTELAEAEKALIEWSDDEADTYRMRQARVEFFQDVLKELERD